MTPSPRSFPGLEVLSGSAVTLEPVTDERRLGELYEALGGEAFREGWTFLSVGPFATREAFDATMRDVLLAQDKRFYAAVTHQTGKAQGFLALMRIDRPNGVIEVGNVALGPQLSATREASEAFFLLFRSVFETLGYRRLEWKCDALNAPSRRAAERLGFTFEGIFRQHMIVKDRNRDTAWFSMLDGEWSAISAAFEAWLAPANFDAEGRQKRGLADLRG